MLDERTTPLSLTSEKDLRRQIDRSVSRALVDGDYARLLLMDPTLALEERGCSLQQFKSLRGIRANNMLDFARQAQSLFWIVDSNPLSKEAQFPRAAAAAR